MKLFLKLFLFLPLALFAAPPTDTAHLSQSPFGITNGMSSNDLFAISSQPLTSSERMRGVYPRVAATTLAPFLPSSVSLLFIGDSTTDERGNTGVSQGSTYPSLLIQKPGWNICSNYFNGGMGSATAQQFNATSNYFSVAYGSDNVNGYSPVNNPVPVARMLPGATNGALLFIDLGYNDAGARTFQQLTNDLGSLWSRGTNCLVVAFTIMTNNTMNNTQVTNVQAINAWIISQSNAYYRCVRKDLVMTNDNLFTAIDHVHPNLAGNLVVANRIALDVPPPVPQMSTFNFNPEPHFRYVSSSNQADFVAIRVSEDSGYVPVWNTGTGIKIGGSYIYSNNDGNRSWYYLRIKGYDTALYSQIGVTIINHADSTRIPTTTNDFMVDGHAEIATNLLVGQYIVQPTNTFVAPVLALGGIAWVNSNGTPWVFYNSNNTTIGKRLVP